MTGRAFAPLPREETLREVELLLQVGEPLQPHLPCHALASTPANAGAASQECMSPLGLASIAERRQASGPEAPALVLATYAPTLQYSASTSCDALLARAFFRSGNMAEAKL